MENTMAKKVKSSLKETDKKPTRSAPANEPSPFPLVGIGASAGGLAALKEFFSHVREDSNLAYVVVVHLSPEQKSDTAELLQPHINLPVQQVTEAVKLEPNHVYVIPPNANLDTIDTHLRLTKLEKRQERAPIDHFFRTLANTHNGKAIGVILTGTGSDGTSGIREIKERGGLTIVQDPNEAEYDGMPQSAIATGVIDLVLPVAKIPRALLGISQTRPNIPSAEVDQAIEDEPRRLLQKVRAQKKAEQAIQESEQRLQKMINIEGVGVLVFNEAGILVNANHAFLEMSGYSRADVESRSLSWRALTPPEYLEVSEQQMDRLAREGRVGPYEKELALKDGSRTWMVFAGATLGDGSFVKYCIDISERKRVEHELLQSKVYAESIVETLHEPLLVLNEDLTIKSANPSFYKLFSVNATETIGRKIYDLGNGQWNIPVLRDLLEDVLPENNVFNDYLVSHDFEDLGHRVMLLNGRRLDHVQLILLGIRDITKQHEYEEEIRKGEERFRLLFDSIDEGFCIVQMIFDDQQKPIDYRFLEVNPAFERHTGIKEAVGRRMREIEPRHEIYWFETYGRIALTRQPLRFEQFSEALSRHYDVYAFPFGEPKQHRIAILFRDISQRKRTEKKLHVLNQSLEAQVAKRTEMLGMLQDVTRAANEAASLEEAMQLALYRIAEYNGWRVGHIWKTKDENSDEFTSSGIWNLDPPFEDPKAIQEFQQLCEQYSFSSGDSLPGRVIKTNQLQWIDDLDKVDDPRFRLAKDLGLQAAIAFPIPINDHVVAVLEYFAEHPIKREKHFLEVMPDIGMQLGHVVERKRLEKRIADTTEMEQRRIGGDIHDGVGQEITGLRHVAQTHLELLQQQSSPAVETAMRIAEWLETIQSQLRTIIRELVPVELDQHGLVSALEALCTQVSKTHSLSCDVTIEGDSVSVTDPRMATHFYRIAQEAIRNAVKHAEASQIHVTLEGNDKELSLQVADDGVGIPQDETKVFGVGMHSMAYRANLIGARLQTGRSAQGGTLIRCSIPRSVS